MHDKQQFSGSAAATWRRACSFAVTTVGVLLLLGACAIQPQPSPAELQAKQAHLTKVQQAKARFEELCKTAGITVNRRVTGVKGIRLEKVPATSRWSDWIDPMWPEAALGGADGGAFLEWLVKRRIVDPLTGRLRGDVTARETRVVTSIPGFEYLDVKQVDGRWKRFYPDVDGSMKFAISSKYVSEGDISPYVVNYDLMTDANDRHLWIAGVSIQVKDARSGEQLGSIVRYIWDQGMGDAKGGRSAWIFAAGNMTCPSMKGYDTFGHFMILIDNIITPGE